MGRCIFCQKSTLNSKSVEHIVPESLGNKNIILEKGWVCDACNNYIAVKIEQPVLQLPFFNQYRHDLDIFSKRGRIPNKDGFLLDEETTKVTMGKAKNKEERIEIDSYLLKQLLAGGIEEIPLITMEFGAPENQPLVSKFLAKIGIEALAWEAKNHGADESVYNQESLNNVKRYIRNAKKGEMWNYTTRRLYNSEAWLKDGDAYIKVISSWAFIVTSDQQLLFQFLFVGTEFTIDMTNPDTQSITQWLAKNNNKSTVLDRVLKQYPQT